MPEPGGPKSTRLIICRKGCLLRNRKVRNGALVPGKFENAFLKQDVYTISSNISKSSFENYNLMKCYTENGIKQGFEAVQSGTSATETGQIIFKNHAICNGHHTFLSSPTSATHPLSEIAPCPYSSLLPTHKLPLPAPFL